MYGCRPSEPVIASLAERGGDALVAGGDSEGARRAAALDALLDGPGQDAWYGVYLRDGKVGSARIRYRRTAPGGVGAFLMEMDMVMSIAGGQEMTMRESRRYAGSPSFALVSARMEVVASGVRDIRELSAGPEGVRVSRSLNGEEQPSREGPPTKEVFTNLLITNPPSPKELAVGSSSEIYDWDWERYGDERLTVTVDKVERRARAGVELPIAVLKLVAHDNGVTMKSVVAEGGVVLELSVGPALRLKAEEEEVAKSDIVGLDILGSGVKIKRRLGDPASIGKLVLRTRLPEGFTLPTAPNQRVSVDDQGRTLITLERAPGDVVTKVAREAALESGPIVDWRQGDIARVAAQLTSGLKTRREKIRALSRWVFDNLDKRLATHLPTASLVMAQRVGDCTEHTWLFSALARASGVPARPVYGLVYSGDKEGTFAYHAWAEVAVDGHWRSVDPTWNQPYADATHLKLGYRIAPVGGVIGGLQLEVVDLERTH